jgi:hypothetical protein
MKTTRVDALHANEPQYCTGKPCKQGHLAPRSTISCECVACRKAWMQHTQARTKALRAHFKTMKIEGVAVETRPLLTAALKRGWA